ncbi:MAG: T9SS type A sorting domain-containing protein [Bacteroidales bacterium]|jgi:hypothetical protein|nr:T9SS type A sorting domain-containing protein [Bacteroidales bacterium]
MKRTLLTLALMLGTVAMMAQTNVAAQKDFQRATINNKMDIAPLSGQKAKPAAKDLTYIWTNDFSDSTSFSFENCTGHTVPGRRFYYTPDTNDLNAFLNTVKKTPGDSPFIPERPDFFNYWFAGAGFSTVDNGFVGVNPWMNYPSINSYTWNTSVTFVNPITNTGDYSVLDVYFAQFGMRFNSERYYIDWSTDPNFTTYDSMEFNVKGVELNANDMIGGVKKLSLPATDEIIKGGQVTHDGIATIGQNALYIRFRYQCGPSAPQPHSYFWFIDDVNIADGGSRPRLDFVSRDHYYGGFYHDIPVGMTPDTIVYDVAVANTGGESIDNAVLQTQIYSVEQINDSVKTYTLVSAPVIESDVTNIATARMEDTTKTSTGTIDYITLTQNRTLTAQGDPIALKTLPAGTYAAISSIRNSSYELVIDDTVEFRIINSAPVFDNENEEFFDWRKANNIANKKSPAWRWGYTTEAGINYLTDVDDGWNQLGYSVCVRYSMQDSENPLFINGVSLVPAPDSVVGNTCQAGAEIIVSLKQNIGGALESAIIPVMDANNQPVESEIVTIDASQLNSSNGATSGVSNLNSIYIPFTSSVALEPNVDYYACYTLQNNSKFAVAADFNFSDYRTFGPGTYPLHTLVYSGAVNNYTWGNYYWGFSCDNRTPMIGLIVSTNANSLSNATETFGSLNLYPNPAQNVATLSYSLKNAGEVSIIVTDIMGREVAKMDEGKRASGINYEANINTANLSNGTYFYTVSVNGAKQTNKFVVNK